MIGAIIGDIVGSRFEFNNTDNKDFHLFTKTCDFTDDTICTIAVADAILRDVPFELSLREWCHEYPNPTGAYGGSFSQWLRLRKPEPYNSYGNGSAMRVSPCAIAAKTDEEARRLAYDSAACTHNHAEGVIGAIATCLAIRRLREDSKFGNICACQSLNHVMCDFYGINWPEHLPAKGVFDVTCQGCVPLAANIIMHSTDFEDAIRNAVAYGGDSDTLAAIVGSMAEAMWGVPDRIAQRALTYLPDCMVGVIKKFYDKYEW